MRDVTALVPMRHHSERVPGKNYRPLAGRPLFEWVLESLLASRVSRLVIDTDSDVIRDVADGRDRIIVLERPAHLRDGSIPMNAVILNTLDSLEDVDLVLQTHSTNPFLTTATIDAAIGSLEQDTDHDSLFSVTRLQTRLWWPDGCPVNHDPAVLLRTQDLPPVYEENSCMYLFTPDLIRRTGTRIGERPILFEIDALEAWDIDDESDWRVAEVLAGERAAGLR